jgi:hypothetical protein
MEGGMAGVAVVIGGGWSFVTAIMRKLCMIAGWSLIVEIRRYGDARLAKLRRVLETIWKKLRLA